MIGSFDHMGATMTGGPDAVARRDSQSPRGNSRRTADDGVIIEEFDWDEAPTFSEMMRRHRAGEI